MVFVSKRVPSVIQAMGDRRMLIFAVLSLFCFQYLHNAFVQTASLEKEHYEGAIHENDLEKDMFDAIHNKTSSNLKAAAIAKATPNDEGEKEQEQEQEQEENREELVNTKQIQPSHGTNMNRYPEQYSFLKELVAHSQIEADKKILSFGCSTGEEPLTLAQQYFEEPSTKVFGVDVADYAVSEAIKKANQAPEGKITILNGREVSPKVYGPFDVVLGNSVFCVFGKKGVPYQNITYVMETFPFSLFESMLDEIDSYLKVGGVLAIFNSNYNFMDTHFADSRYEPIADKKCPNHFVPRIDRENKKFVDVKDEMIDCLFRKVKS